MKNHLLYWIVTALVLIAFLLGDAAVIVWSASLLTLGQLSAAVIAFGLIGAGVFVTAWKFRTA